MSDGDDDPGETTEDKLATLPEAAAPGDIWQRWAECGNRIQEQNINELARERAGDSPRHLMLLPEDDPKEMERREEQKRHEQLIAEHERRDLIERQNHLLVQIEECQIELEKHRREIEDNALRLHDGRRAYIDGSQYRDGEGRVLAGQDEVEAARAHGHQPLASTWSEKQEADRKIEEARALKQRILNDREDGIQSSAKLSAYEREVRDKLETRAAQAPTDYGSADYMAELGGAYTISSVPAFTDAASAALKAGSEKKDTDVADTTLRPRPLGQGAFKPC
jgi:hypothetical protein